jgi:hypothetical protein
MSRRSRAAIEPLNIAGLCDPGKRNWYPVDLQDTVRGAAKLGVRPERAAGDLRVISFETFCFVRG